MLAWLLLLAVHQARGRDIRTVHINKNFHMNSLVKSPKRGFTQSPRCDIVFHIRCPGSERQPRYRVFSGAGGDCHS